MKLTMDALRALNEIKEYSDQLDKANVTLSSEIMKLTEGKFKACTGTVTDGCYQLFHMKHTCSYTEAVEVLKALADNGELAVRWDDATQLCYRFKIDNISFCVVLDKEVAND